MNELSIRRVCASDAKDIVGIYRYYVENTTVTFDEVAPTVEQMKDTIERISKEWPYLIAEMNGEVIGYCYVHPWKEKRAYRCTLETTIYLRHDVTAQGVGGKMMKSLIDACRDMGTIHSLIACITAENEGSIRFHSGLGFERVSLFREVGYKFDRYLDVVDMELILD